MYMYLHVLTTSSRHFFTEELVISEKEQTDLFTPII